MKNMKLPNSDEWEKIIDDAFSSDELHTFSESYNMKKHSMHSVRKGITMKKNNLIMNLTVAAAALTVVAVPTAVYIGSNANHTPTATEVSDETQTDVSSEVPEITSSDEVTLAENTDEEFVTENAEVTVTDGEDDGQVNEETHNFTEENIDFDTIYDVEYGWLPEGLEYQEDDSPYGRKFHNWTTEDGMTPIFTKVMESVTYTEDTGNPEIATTKDEWLLDGKTVSMYYRSTYIPDNPEYNFGRIAFIYFDNTPYVLQLYVTDGISEEDFRKIIDNVKLVPSDTETAYIYTPSQNEQENTDFTVGSYENMGISVEDSTIAQVGEKVYEKNPDIWGNVSAKVTGVRFDNDFNGLTTDGIGLDADYSEYLNEDGTLVENVRKWIEFENGTEIEHGTETVPISVMTVNITYTNNGKEPVDDYCICPTLQTKYDGYFFKQRICDIVKTESELETNGMDCIDTFRHLTADDIHFSFSCPNQSDKNNIHLDGGESTEVTLAFIVEDNLRDNLYLSMNDNGYVDLSNIE